MYWYELHVGGWLMLNALTVLLKRVWNRAYILLFLSALDKTRSAAATGKFPSSDPTLGTCDDKKSGGQKQFPALFLFWLFDNWDSIVRALVLLHWVASYTYAQWTSDKIWDEELMGK